MKEIVTLVAHTVRDSTAVRDAFGREFFTHAGIDPRVLDELPLPQVVVYPPQRSYAPGGQQRTTVVQVEAALAQGLETEEIDGVSWVTGQFTLGEVLETIGQELLGAFAEKTNLNEFGVSTEVNPAVEDGVFSGTVVVTYTETRYIGGYAPIII